MMPELPSIEHTPKEYRGPSAEQVLQMRRRHLTPSLLTYYKKPIMIVEGHMQYLYDEMGKRYLDGFAGIVTVSVGHCHPDVVEAAKHQLETLQHTTTIYLHPVIAEYGSLLAHKFPTELSVCYFVNSGSEANDLAILLARLYTGNYDILSLRNAYHGGTPSSMGLTAHSTWKYSTPMGFGVHHALNPNPYRGPYGHDDPEAGKKYAADVEDIIKHATPGPVAGFIAESIQGVGGAVVYPPEYLHHVYKIVREAGGVCIADEVQTGFGRTGEAYWGYELQQVVPDIVTLAKGIGNGVPLAAVVTRPEIAEVLTQRTHFNTFGGNPVSCAVGKTVLEIIDREQLQENSLKVGNYLFAGLERLKEKHPLIGEVRGKGLMIGVELVTDRTTKEPAKEACAVVHERAKELGLLIGKGGLYANVLRIKPPMCMTVEDAEYMLNVLDIAFQEAPKKS